MRAVRTPSHPAQVVGLHGLRIMTLHRDANPDLMVYWAGTFESWLAAGCPEDTGSCALLEAKSTSSGTCFRFSKQQLVALQVRTC
jgi:hypothetical protein